VTAKPVVLRERADRDIDAAVAHYRGEAGARVALAFIDAIEQAFRQIAQHPASRSPRYAHELDLPGLRSCWPKRRPYLVFYLERPDHIDVWRVLHVQRDIPAWLQEPEGP
jgi:toxin ParE1/3/4